MRSVLSHVLVLVVVPLWTSAAWAQDMSRKDFDEFRAAFRGTWVGQVRWVANWPGLGKQGELVTGYLEIRETENGNALIVRFQGGEGTGTGIWGYNPGEKTITARMIYSGGTISNITYKKDGGAWLETVSGFLPDGRKSESTSRLTLSDDGKSLRAQGTGTIDGVPNAPRDDKWQLLYR
jgi:hypothetical protein